MPPRNIAAVTVVALALATGACSENRPFERENNGAQAKLAVPSSMTPPISVRGINGAPDTWKLAARVADALRSRDIAASSALRGHHSYVLKGALRQGKVQHGRSQVEVVWTLLDESGRKVGEVTQMAAVPGGVFKAPNDGVIDAMADAAAESIAPLVPSSSVQLADGIETGERRPNERAKMEERDRVTAIGKMPVKTGVAKNLLERRKAPPVQAARAAREAARDAARGPIPRTRGPAAPPSTLATRALATGTPVAGNKNSLTAVGRYNGASALSRNLFRTDVDAAKTLPPPRQRLELPPRKPADAEESLGARPIPAGEFRSEAPAEPGVTRLLQRAEADTGKTDVGLGRAPAETVRPAAPPTETVHHAAAPAPTRVAWRQPPRPHRARGALEFWVQVGANREQAKSQAEWQSLRRLGGDIFADVGNRIQRADLRGRGVFYRIQVGPFASAGEASRFCGRLKSHRIDCFLPPPERAAVSEPPPIKTAAPKTAAPKMAAPKTTAPETGAPGTAPSKTMEPKMAAPKTAPPATMPPATHKDTASAPPEKHEATPARQPPRPAKAEKPEAPLSTAPGLPGLD